MERLNETTRWVGPETQARKGAKCAWLTIITGTEAGRVFPLEEGEHVIGRGPEASVQLRDEEVSRAHTRLAIESDGSATVRDCGSRNGTLIGTRPIGSQPVPLRDGSKIQIGGAVVVRFSFRDSIEESFERELYNSANRDHLTGAFNKRHFDKRLQEEFEASVRHNRSLSLVLFDLDEFKSINDRWGHPAGDQVLREIVRRCSNVLREGELLARYGGEEFVVLLRQTGVPGSVMVAERLRRELERSDVLWQGESLSVSASFGVATSSSGRHLCPDELIQAADSALYRSKRAGKNRVCGPGR